MISILAAVVVELFTSQGCSSCPPADALVRELRKDPNVIPIAYHVDYWNYLGWRDPFSSPDWTLRQMQYVRAFRLNSAYTPEIVVDGARQMVGSNEPEVRAAIQEAEKRGSVATVEMKVGGGVATIETEAPRGGLELVVVTTEDGIVTKIERGENRGVTLTNDAIARSITRLNVGIGTSTHRVSVSTARGTVIAILQDPTTLKILAAAAVPTASSRP